MAPTGKAPTPLTQLLWKWSFASSVFISSTALRGGDALVLEPITADVALVHEALISGAMSIRSAGPNLCDKGDAGLIALEAAQSGQLWVLLLVRSDSTTAFTLACRPHRLHVSTHCRSLSVSTCGPNSLAVSSSTPRRSASTPSCTSCATPAERRLSDIKQVVHAFGQLGHDLRAEGMERARAHRHTACFDLRAGKTQHSIDVSMSLALMYFLPRADALTMQL